MKKLVVFLSLLFALSACGANQEKQNTEKDGSVSEVSEEASSKEEEQSTKSEESQESSGKDTGKELPEGYEYFELGKPVDFGDFKVTIKKLEIVKDADDKPALKYTYDFENTGKEQISPSSFVILGFQDKIQVDRNPPTFYEGEVNYQGSTGVLPGGVLKDGEGAIKLDNTEDELLLELVPTASIKYTTYMMGVDPKTLK